jgi:hypothetical protein
MCEARAARRGRLARRVAVVAVLAAAPAARLAAQSDRAAALAAARDRVARLGAAWRAESLADARAQRARDALPTDTVVVAGFRILSEPQYESVVRASATRAAGRLDSAFGDAAMGLRANLLVIRPSAFLVERRFGPRTVRYVPAQIGVLEGGTLHETYRERVPSDDPAGWADLLVRLGSTWLVHQADSALADWLQSPLDVLSPIDRSLQTAYEDLVTSPSQVARQCFVGDLMKCREAVGVTAVADPALTWYAPVERRDVVRRLRLSLRVRRDVATYDACVDGGSDDACLRLLRGAPAGALPLPLGAAARHTWARIALRAGGPGAWARLTSGASAPLDARFAAAAGVSADSLTATWLEAVRAARPVPVPVTEATAWAAFAWGMLFAGLALRSTRWR